MRKFAPTKIFRYTVADSAAQVALVVKDHDMLLMPKLPSSSQVWEQFFFQLAIVKLLSLNLIINVGGVAKIAM